MSDADRSADGGGLSCPARDAMVATLLGITPERLRTIRRVQRKRSGGSASSVGGTAARWQRVDELSDDALFATFRRHELRGRTVARAGTASPWT